MNEEYYNEWKKDCLNSLEEGFYNTLPPEDLPLDDDMPEYMEAHNDIFEEYCKQMFINDMEAQGK